VDLKASIDQRIERCLPKISEEPRIIHKAMRYCVFPGGKRIRPIIVLEACKACGGKDKDALTAACAVELIHTYSLIHDDLPSMDDDDFRRGKPSCHKKFGEANAILAGDALLTLAFNILAADLEPKTAVKIIKELSEAAGTHGMVGGQVLDLATSSLPGRGTDPEGIPSRKGRGINYLKTARIFEAAAKIGAMAAGASGKKIKAMAGFGINFGMAFQLADDIADKDGLGFTDALSARREANRLIGKAKESLEIFGPRADGLAKIADLLLT